MVKTIRKAFTRGFQYVVKTKSKLNPQTRLCQTKGQILAFQMVHKPLFYLSDLFSYSLLTRSLPSTSKN